MIFNENIKRITPLKTYTQILLLFFLKLQAHLAVFLNVSGSTVIFFACLTSHGKIYKGFLSINHFLLANLIFISRVTEYISKSQKYNS